MPGPEEQHRGKHVMPLHIFDMFIDISQWFFWGENLGRI